MKESEQRPHRSAYSKLRGGAGGVNAAFAFLCVLLVLAMLLAGRDVISTIYRSTGTETRRISIERAISWNPTAWSTRVEYAELLRAIGDSSGAIAQYEAAIANFRGCASCWIGIAEAQLATREDPLDSLRRAVTYGRSRTDVRTRAASVYARIGQDDLAAAEFAAAVLGKQDDQQEFFGLLTRIYDVDFVLERMIPDSLLEAYFTYGRAQLGPEDVASIWTRYEQYAGPTQRHYYTGYLINKGLVRSAWRLHFDRSEDESIATAIIDGGFEDGDDHGWFGWHMSDAPGVTASRAACPQCDDSGRALRIEFDGEHNPHFFGVRQDVPVESRRSYVLSASGRSQGISSTNGVAVFVQGLPVADRDGMAGCQLWESGEQFLGDNNWTRYELQFSVPEGCEGVRILVGRPQSRHLNKFIGGEFWLDDVELREIPSGFAAAG